MKKSIGLLIAAIVIFATIFVPAYMIRSHFQSGPAAPAAVTTPSSSSAKPLPAPLTDIVVDKTSSTIGAQGGEVNLKNGAKLVVPAGSLTKSVTVELKQVTEPLGFGNESTAYDVTGLGGITGATTLIFPTATGLKAEQLEVSLYDAGKQKYEIIPFDFNAASGAVTVTISPAQAAAGWSSSGLMAPLSVDLMQAVAAQTANDAAVSSGTRVVWNMTEEIQPKRTEHVIPMPYYVQVGGDCGSADILMMLRAYAPASNKQTAGDVMHALYTGTWMPEGYAPETWINGPVDSDFGFDAASKVAMLRDYVKSQTGIPNNVSVTSLVQEKHVWYQLCEHLDNDMPVMLEYTKPGHFVLVVGYRDSGKTFVINDSQGAGAGMYTIRTWSWIWSNMKPDTPTTLTWMRTALDPGYALQSIGCPGAGDKSPVSEVGKIEFGISNPKLPGHYNPLALLRFQPSVESGYCWWDVDNKKSIDTIPSAADVLYLGLPLWNADRAPANVSVDVSLFTASVQLGTYHYDATLEAAIDNSTAIKELKNSIQLAQSNGSSASIRRAELADKDGNQKLKIDVTLSKGGTFCDGFTLNTQLSVIPQITKLDPATAKAGDTVVVNGYCFGVNQSPKGAVTVGGIDAKIVSWSDKSISIKVPDDAKTGSQPVIVTTGDRYTYKSDPVNLNITGSAAQNALSGTISFSDSFYWGSLESNPQVLNVSGSWQVTGKGISAQEDQYHSHKYFWFYVSPDVPIHLVVNVKGILGTTSDKYGPYTVELKIPDQESGVTVTKSDAGGTFDFTGPKGEESRLINLQFYVKDNQGSYLGSPEPGLGQYLGLIAFSFEVHP